MRSPGPTPKAAWNSPMLDSGPLTRSSGGPCGSVASRRAAASRVELQRHTCAQERKKRWMGVKPSASGSACAGCVAARWRGTQRAQASARRGQPRKSERVL